MMNGRERDKERRSERGRERERERLESARSARPGPSGGGRHRGAGRREGLG